VVSGPANELFKGEAQGTGRKQAHWGLGQGGQVGKRAKSDSTKMKADRRKENELSAGPLGTSKQLERGRTGRGHRKESNKKRETSPERSLTLRRKTGGIRNLLVALNKPIIR